MPRRGPDRGRPGRGRWPRGFRSRRAGPGLRGDALELLQQANRTWSSPHGAILRSLLAAAADEPELLDLLREGLGGDAVDAAWLALLGRAVTRGEATPAAVHRRVAAVPITLLQAGYALRGVASVPDQVLIEIVDEVFLPLVRGRARAGQDPPAP